MKYEAVSGEIVPDSMPSIPITTSNAAAMPQSAQSHGSGHRLVVTESDGAPPVSRNRAPAVTYAPAWFWRRQAGRTAPLPNALQDAHVVGDRRAAHVEEAAKPRILDLKITGRASELHRGKRMHRHAGRTD